MVASFNAPLNFMIYYNFHGVPGCALLFFQEMVKYSEYVGESFDRSVIISLE